jgi:hypothetical protein
MPSEEPGIDTDRGLLIEFTGFDDVELAFESLARERSGIELRNVRRRDDVTRATVFIPEGKLTHFEKLITDYLTERRDARGYARDNRQLIDTIREIRAATLGALWTDDDGVFPQADEERIWWEVWLPVRRDRQRIIEAFRSLATGQGVEVKAGELVFPERSVLLAYGSPAQFKRSALLLSLIAELRRAKETAEFFDSLPALEQREWVEELLLRATFPASGADVPHICLLDTGVNNGHPLIAPALHHGDLHTVQPAWGTDDNAGHGTLVAGLATLGDLTKILQSGDPVRVTRRLESVKLLQNDGGNAGDPEFHGLLTAEAVARPEITDPARHRVFSLTVTSRDNRDRGRPSAWSATVDRLASDAENEGASPRLLIVAAGNVNDNNAWKQYPASNKTDSIHDPGQAWNALTIGACTDLIRITEDDAASYNPIASAGGLSPFSTTSVTWQPAWPLKPDVLMEGGNAADDGLGAVSMSSLSLLTTHHRPQERHFTTTNATSAATALAAGLAAELMAAYPELWPETIRALVVQSAQWTQEMRRRHLPQNRTPNKSDYSNLVRHCGFGVPDLDRALWSVSNSLTLIVQEELHPFERKGSSQPTLRHMHLHRIPWPKDELEQLGETEVEMRVTLSYFIEPNPSARGRSRYRYESHGLRFDVCRGHESLNDFRARVNGAARDEEEGTPVSGEDAGWKIGKNNRHRGSLHSDIWSGTAADLASRGFLAVYPALGWWKTRTTLERWAKPARYALIVSIHAPRIDIDLYTPIANLIQARVVIGT